MVNLGADAEMSVSAEFDTTNGIIEPPSLSFLAQIEAVIFAAPSRIKASEIQEFLQQFDLSCTLSRIKSGLDSLMVTHNRPEGGFRLVFIENEGYQFQTVPAAAGIMELMFQSRPRPLSRAALETLAIIAYRHPTTRAEVERVRGVDTGSIIKTLLDRGLIRCSGRRDDAGRPMLFETDAEFLRIFGINSLADLPPLSAFQPIPETMREALEALDGALPPSAAELALPGEVPERPEIPLLSADSNDLGALDPTYGDFGSEAEIDGAV